MSSRASWARRDRAPGERQTKTSSRCRASYARQCERDPRKRIIGKESLARKARLRVGIRGADEKGAVIWCPSDACRGWPPVVRSAARGLPSGRARWLRDNGMTVGCSDRPPLPLRRANFRAGKCPMMPFLFHRALVHQQTADAQTSHHQRGQSLCIYCRSHDTQTATYHREAQHQYHS